MARLNVNNLEYFANRIISSLPIDGQHVKDEFKNNLKPVLESLFEKLEIVTREEFEIQKEILRKTRAKVDELEKLMVNIKNN
ncbi:accessory factor UbiK family protein [Pseudomonadota bacterium]|nr:accessory factor UbiK family protein [Pseudomonadota bacterium]|tara:strand:+ start:190 stop:435 length:246 start_codon:yes stop_codon:yes gene_type:complete